MSDLDTQRQALADLACPDGGWGYAPGLPPHLEPTCLALLALPSEAFAAKRQAALAWLDSCALSDGTYRLPTGRREAVWPTALVLFTRLALGEANLEATARALLALRGRANDMRGQDDISDIDGMLIGWPWGENNFSWVEPTAWAILALRRAGQGDHPRVAEGQKLLLDRMLETGGVNYGNRRIFGITLEPIPTPTALALLALQGRDEDAQVRTSLDYLRRSAESATDVEHLAWSIIALGAYGQGDLDALRHRLLDACRAREQTPYVRPAPLRMALTCLALATDEASRPHDAKREGEAPAEPDQPRSWRRDDSPRETSVGSAGASPSRLRSANPFRLAVPAARPLEPGKLATESKPIGQMVQGWVQGVAVFAANAMKPLPPTSEVHIAPASDYNADLADVLNRQYAHYREKVPLRGKRVVLKPNLVEYHRDKVINTDPRFVAAVVELCQREGAGEVIVAEGPGHWRNVEHLVKESGLGDVLRTYKVPFIDLNHDEPVKRVNLSRLTKLEHLYLSRTILSADVVISLPRLKTHYWAVATLSLKNLFGTMPGICYGWPKNELHWRGIDNSIVDIAATRTPDLAIVDGIVGMEGDGPLNGTPKPMGVIVMGADLVAVDATCCRLMKLDPAKVAYLVMASRKKVGLLEEVRITQLGETIAARAKPFDTVPQLKAVWMGPRDGP